MHQMPHGPMYGNYFNQCNQGYPGAVPYPGMMPNQSNIDSVTGRQRNVCEEKVRMDGIKEVTKLDQFHHFGIQLKVMCGDRYALLVVWLEWLMGLLSPPDEAAVNAWAGGHREATETMAEDVWGFCVSKSPNH